MGGGSFELIEFWQFGTYGGAIRHYLPARLTKFVNSCNSLLRRLSPKYILLSIIHFLHEAEILHGLLAASLLEEAACLVGITFQELEDTTGVEGFRTVAGVGEVDLGAGELSGAEGDGGNVHVGHRVVGIDGGGGFEHAVVVVTANGIKVGNAVHLVEREQARVFLQYFGGLFVGHGAHLVRHFIVGMTEIGVPCCPDEAVGLRPGLLDIFVLRVWLHVRAHDLEDVVFLRQVAADEEAVEASPVFGRVLHRVDVGREVVLAAHVFFQRGGTSFREADVVFIRPFWRGVAVDADVRDAHVGVVSHRVDGAHDFMQLRRVVVVVGIKLRAVDGEVEVGTSVEREDGVGGGHRWHESEAYAAFEVWVDIDGRSGTRSEEVAAAAGVFVDAERGVGHPGFEGDGFAVFVGLLFPIAASQFNGIGIVFRAVAEEHVVLVASVDHDRAEGGDMAVGVFHDGREHHLAVAGEAEAVEHEAPGDNEGVACNRTFKFLVAHETIALVGRGGRGE